MPKEIKHSISQGGIRHDNHAAPATLTKRDLSPKVNYILIKNRSNSKTALISFDGLNTYTLDPKESFSLEGSGLISYWTGQGSGAANLEVIVAGEE